MARKRMIDPGIWYNVQVTRLSVLQRLLYIGLISNADDEGRLKGDPLYIKGIVFPHDNITPQAIGDCLKRIAKESLIVRYRANGAWYVQHPNWTRWQYIQKAHPSALPPPPTIPVTDRYRSDTVLKQQQTNPVETNPEQSKTTESNPAEKKLDGATETGVPFSRSLELLLSHKVARKVAIEIAHRAPYSQILTVCKYAQQCKNPGGAIVTAFRQGWTVPKAD